MGVVKGKLKCHTWRENRNVIVRPFANNESVCLPGGQNPWLRLSVGVFDAFRDWFGVKIFVSEAKMNGLV